MLLVGSFLREVLQMLPLCREALLQALALELILLRRRSRCVVRRLVGGGVGVF